MSQPDAVVIGAGPNGLAAAITLARAGRSVRVYEAEATLGGGCRSAELIEPGFTHDVCAAVHALGVSSPFFREMPLADFGLEWCHPDLPLAHALDHGRSVAATRSLDDMASMLGSSIAAYRRVLGPLVAHFDELNEIVLSPVLRVPRHPLLLARFGLPSLLPATRLAKAFGDDAGALLAGCAAHSFLPLEHVLTSSFGLVLLASAHAVGWPVARGGSQQIVDSMARYLRSLGGEIIVDHPVRMLSDMAPARVVLADVTPGALARIAADRVPASFARRAARYRHGPGVFKIDYTLDAPVPWRDEVCRRAGTVHLGGDAAEIATSERAMWREQHAVRPYVLVAQSSLVDPSRAPDGKHTLWAYCHVPAGSTEDRTQAIENQLERFAPGFRDIVRGRHTMNSAAYERYNANNVGGDIAGGAYSVRQILARGVGLRPYRTGADDILSCGASTPPGPGVHGMSGVHAARVALRGVLR